MKVEDLAGKHLCVVGRLAGKYATRRRELEGRLALSGATLSMKLHPSADLVVLASKAKGFMKRVARMGVPTLTEAELELLVEGAYDRARAPRESPDRWHLVEALRATVPPLYQAVRNVLIEAGSRGRRFDFGTAPTRQDFPSHEPDGPARELLAWCGESPSWYVLNHPPEPVLRKALQHLTIQPVFTGDDCSFETLAAAARVATAAGISFEDSLRGELENRDACLADLGLSEAVWAEPVVAERLTTPAAFDFVIERLWVVQLS